MSKVEQKIDYQPFLKRLGSYKQLMDEDIERYCKATEKSTLQQYGQYSRLSTDAYLEMLRRGGKRIRGSLVMLGYEMSGGKDQTMILRAARAIEMIHTYILIIDDIQDRSQIRRGGPTAHVMLADYHRQQHLAGSAEHFGVAIALNAALGGGHAAQMILANLPTDKENRLKVVSIVNRTMVVTAHGQTNDIVNEMTAETDEAAIDRVNEWKTAQYSLLNPLHVGMVLAGADSQATDAITPYAIHTGKAYQITDDILGIFGTEHESGKSPGDDIREGKRTLLTAYALKHAGKADKNFLISMLGNQLLTPVEFERCKDILADVGALAYAQQAAAAHIQQAIVSLDEHEEMWSAEGVKFLRGLAAYLLDRQA